MPLTKGQVNYIQACVEHFFYGLPKESSKLSNEISRIQRAFTHTLEQNDPDYGQLQQFIINPCEYLKQLEKHSKESAKLGEIRCEMLNIANTQISEAAKEAKLELTKKIWDKDVLETQLKNEKDAKNEYKPSKTQIAHGPDPYQLPHQEGQYYKAWTYPDAKQLTANVHAEIEVRDLKTSFDIAIEELPDFKDDQDQDMYFTDDIAPFARDSASNTVVNQMIKYLQENKLAPPEKIDRANPSINLLLYKVYIEMILERRIQFDDLLKLDKNHVSLLQEPVIIKLIQEKKETIASLQKTPLLRRDQLELISHPHYYQQFIKGDMKIADVIPLDTKTCKNLVYPPALYLQSKYLISKRQIKEMFSGTKRIIGNEFYLNKLAKGELEYKQVEHIDMDKGDLYVQDYVIKAVANGTLPIHLLNCLDANASKETIALIVEKKISHQDAARLVSDSVIQIESRAIVRHLINENLISATELNQILCSDSHFPVEDKFDSKPFNKAKKEEFKSALNEFLKLATAGLVNETDIGIFYSIFNNKMPDEKTQMPDISWVRKSFFQRCMSVAIHRLSCILRNQPLELHRYQEDTILKVQLSCKQFDIPFVEVRDIAFNGFIKHFYTTNTKSINEIIDLGKKLGFSELNISIRMLGIRLVGLFSKPPYYIDQKPDTFAHFKLAVLSFSKLINHDQNQLYQASIEFLLKYLKNRLDPFYTGVSKFHPEILAVLLNQDSKSSLSPSEVLQKIITLAKGKIDFLRGLVKTSPTLFSPQNYLNSPDLAYDLCEKIIALAELLPQANQNLNFAVHAPGQSNHSSA